MHILVASWIVRITGIYLALGILFAVLFVWRGAGKIDPSAKQATAGFRLMIFPGAAALWPLLLWRWLRRSSHPPQERNAHRLAAGKRGQEVGA
ncbi:hypothetical protein EDS67_02240 [candidate division KSB1 bacterium]|nr:MAG: hypothetical protein EDS67_02240 [candidate division KSB1 bacterium]MBC6946758.1 hypothetical protein [candidate division KSB1 bacterium]MCE7941850.1 hypothetical protein [Chlorobi bacterium CHB1]MDL1876416.1 hypothetical protein [Cytophagia bacterium CHB2]